VALVPAEFVLPPVLDEEPPLLTLELPAALAPATDVPPPPPELVAAESSLLLLQPQSNVISVIEPTVFTSLRIPISFPSRRTRTVESRRHARPLRY
jgi:hypothetical protein